LFSFITLAASLLSGSSGLGSYGTEGEATTHQSHTRKRYTRPRMMLCRFSTGFQSSLNSVRRSFHESEEGKRKVESHLTEPENIEADVAIQVDVGVVDLRGVKGERQHETTTFGLHRTLGASCG
jgi:hypothetical protein